MTGNFSLNEENNYRFFDLIGFCVELFENESPGGNFSSNEEKNYQSKFFFLKLVLI